MLNKSLIDVRGSSLIDAEGEDSSTEEVATGERSEGHGTEEQRRPGQNGSKPHQRHGNNLYHTTQLTINKCCLRLNCIIHAYIIREHNYYSSPYIYIYIYIYLRGLDFPYHPNM